MMFVGLLMHFMGVLSCQSYSKDISTFIEFTRDIQITEGGARVEDIDKGK